MNTATDTLRDRRRRRMLGALAGGAALAPIATFAPLARAGETGDGRRLALVIGNAAYRRMPLKNPVSDARAIAQAMGQVGFQTTLRENLPLRELVTAFRDFTDRSGEAALRFIYFAGHGLQIKGRNHLLPTDVEEAKPDSEPARTAALDDILDRLSVMRSGANIVVLDACRANPYSVGDYTTPDGRRIQLRQGGRQGLAQLNAPFGTLIAFSTTPGSVALDNPSESHSIYAKHFLAQLRTPVVLIEQFFKRVRAGVAEETARRQIPWENSSLTGDVCWRSGPGCPG